MRSLPKIVAIHDLSGFGRTSLTVVIPILSTMGIQVCPLPTAVLSTHTAGFTDFTFHDLSGEMNPILDHWKKLGLSFEAVYSGFLADANQAKIVERAILECKEPKGLAIVDPVLGDNGILDPTMNQDIVQAMRKLVGFADIITPNFTEASLLLDREYLTEISNDETKKWLRDLVDLGAKTAVITSVPNKKSKETSVVAYDRKNFWKVNCPYIPAHYPGTGDIFTSVLTGSLMQGDSLPLAMDRAVQFVTLGIRASFGYSRPYRDGILLERVLESLRLPVNNASYELMA